ncbi:MAG: nicotinamide-nucleotide amidohydrolase family protein [Betaproteobacteria bacterium]|nr:nicotinamide-nucleotide amidohydrolase family protein [Betaproteobacteria bacterium]
MIDQELFELAAAVGRVLGQRGDTLASAESCTGGWIGQVVTMIPGSSSWYDRGFITYSNASKRAVLDVRDETLERHGAVSEPTVLEMVEGALRHSDAGMAVAVSGVAGPGGGSAEKPVGTVCLAWGLRDGTRAVLTCRFAGDRDAVRRQTVIRALEGVTDLAGRPAVA